ncbi:syndecan 1 [Lentzea jiangxiensis]|uniref:Syndecan 1 n=1 Tax=Lentzea jiangxiensis TaxID=641025 RepID=A0A1H0WSA7_9PSEU|nr:syndecan 1 [Lentzea jiangxiensis]
MGFWDRWRRGTQPAEEPAPAQVTAPAAPAWDGGWRALPPLGGVVQRSSVAVGDGLRFRDGLPSWQDPRLGGEMGHSVSVSAPSGLIGGVTGPEVSERSRYSGGGPLLVAWPRETAGSTRPGLPGDAAGPEDSGVPPVVRRSVAAAVPQRSGAVGSGSKPSAVVGAGKGPKRSGGGETAGAAGATSSGAGAPAGAAAASGVGPSGVPAPSGVDATGAVQLRQVRPPLTVARPSLPPARPLSVVGARSPEVVAAETAAAGERPGSAAVVQRSAPVLGEPLTAMPPTAGAGPPAARPAGGERAPVVRSAVPPAGGPPVVRRSAAPTPDGPVRSKRGTRIGEPLPELPITAAAADKAGARRSAASPSTAPAAPSAGANAPRSSVPLSGPATVPSSGPASGPSNVPAGVSASGPSNVAPAGLSASPVGGPAARGQDVPAVQRSADRGPATPVVHANVRQPPPPLDGSAARRSPSRGGVSETGHEVSPAGAPVRRDGAAPSSPPGSEVVSPLGTNRPVRRAIGGMTPAVGRPGHATAPASGRLPVVPVTRLQSPGETTVQRSVSSTPLTHRAPERRDAPERGRATPRGEASRPRVLPLIPERPLTTNTGTGLPQPVRHAAARPVVRPQWPGARHEPTGLESAPTTRRPADPRAGAPAGGDVRSSESPGQAAPRARWFGGRNAAAPVVNGSAATGREPSARGPADARLTSPAVGRRRSSRFDAVQRSTAGTSGRTSAPTSTWTSAPAPAPASTSALAATSTPASTWASTSAPAPHSASAQAAVANAASRPQPVSAPVSARPVTAPAAGPAVRVQRRTDASPRRETGATPVVHPTPPRPLDSGQKLPPIAHPHPNGAPQALGGVRTPAQPGVKQVAVQRRDAGVSEPPHKPAPRAAGRPGTAAGQPGTAGRPLTGERGDDGKPLDLEELARRLLDPLGRLLRAELREGRERTGRLHDRRR